MMPDEASDLTAAAAGDWEAFARLYDRHAGMVLSLCRRRSWSLEEAEDATQETCLRAYPILGRLESVEALRAWLFRAATRVCSERRRAVQRRKRHEMSAASQRTEDHKRQSTPSESASPPGQGCVAGRLTAADWLFRGLAGSPHAKSFELSFVLATRTRLRPSASSGLAPPAPWAPQTNTLQGPR